MDITLATRLGLTVALAVGALAACGDSSGGATNGAAAASCVGPMLSVAPSDAHAGDRVRASGEWFAADCYDTGQAGAPPPLTAMSIEVRQGDNAWTVASEVDATGSHYTFDVPIDLPAALTPGDAEVAVKGYGRPVRLHVMPVDS